MPTGAGSKKSAFTFKSGTENVRIPLEEILYYESDGNYLKLFTKEQEYRLRDTVTAVENALSTSGFVRIHSGFLVNQSAVKKLSAEEAELINGVRIPIGKSWTSMPVLVNDSWTSVKEYSGKSWHSSYDSIKRAWRSVSSPVDVYFTNNGAVIN